MVRSIVRSIASAAVAWVVFAYVYTVFDGSVPFRQRLVSSDCLAFALIMLAFNLIGQQRRASKK